MPYISDRQRVELAIPARLVFGLVCCNPFSDPDAPEVEKIKNLMMQACVEPLDGLPEKKVGQLARRIERLHDEIADMVDQASSLKVSMAFFYMLEHLIERGVLVLWEGSAFGEAITMMTPMFVHGFEEAKVDKSAQKTARKILATLQSHGYLKE